MYRKGPGPSNWSGLDENPNYTCPDQAELPALVFPRLFRHAEQRSFLPPIMIIERNWHVRTKNKHG